MNDPSGSPTSDPKTTLPPKGTFGRILLDQRLLTARQLQDALETQRERSRRGDFARLGHILVEKGYLTPEQVQQVLQAQAITIVACEGCASQYNVRGYAPQQRRYDCPKCHSSLAPVTGLKNVAVQDQIHSLSGGSSEDLQEGVAEEGEETTHSFRVGTLDSLTHTERIRQLRLLGKYEILGEIARGGMGVIYKARQLDLDRVVALKTLRQEELSKPDAVERFRGEAQAVAGLRHPHIVEVYEVGAVEGIQYFTMQFIEGLPLDRKLLRGALSPQQAVSLTLPIAEALEYAHRKGVVHRDLKPANIIIDLEEMPFLVDWGIAKRMDQGLAPDEEEDLLGSIPYMAPEYVEGDAYDELCDLYSLGVVLYELLAGPNCLPYFDVDTRRFLEKIVSEPPVPIQEQVPGLDPELAEMVESMISRRADRYTSCSEVVADMRRWLVRMERASEEATTRRLRRDDAPPVEGEVPAGRSGWPSWVPPTAIGVALVTALSSVGVVARERLEQRDLRDELAARDQAHVKDVTAMALGLAKELVERDQPDLAVRLLNDVIDRLRDQPTETLAEAYRLRGTLRKEQGDPGADEDLVRARQISGPGAE